ncbi:MAG TPA: aldo/keto reductase [Acidobacteriota bacterium]|nr:aldo/keto reductase [Acidobacteriota bacterium]
MTGPHTELAPGYSVPPIIIGLWQLSEGHARAGAGDRSRVLADLERFVEAGLCTFDCADIYTGVEELLGDLRRSLSSGAQIRVHTKFVPDRDALAAIDRGYVERIIHRSLRRLGVERLDLVQFYWWDADIPGYLDTAGWLCDLQRAGKIRLLAATNLGVDRLLELAAAGVQLVSNQVQYSVLDRRPEHALVDYCATAHAHLLCYGTVAGGFLSNRWLGVPEPGAPWTNRSLEKYRLIIDEFGGWEAFQKLLQVLASVGERHAATIANVATRWVLGRPGVAAAIVGARNADHLAELTRTFELTLDADDCARIDGVLARQPGPGGDVFSLERDFGGPHAAIMRTNLNGEAG